MKKLIVRIVNKLLRPFNAELRQRGLHNASLGLGMSSMLIRLAKRKIPVKTVVDIGASNAKWSIDAMQYFPDAFFYAIEPLVEHKKSLEQTKQQNKKFDYELCVAGATDKETVVLNVTNDLDGTTVNGQNQGSPRECFVRTMDSLLMEKALPGPYLLKLDTHGYEIPILTGCKNTLKNTAVLIIEAYNFQLTASSLKFHELCAHMETLGFRTIDVADPMLRQYDQAFWQIDLLFVRSDFNGFDYPHYK